MSDTNKNSNKTNEKLESLKNEVAEELDIDLDAEDLTSKEAGEVGGEMVKRMVEEAKSNN